MSVPARVTRQQVAEHFGVSLGTVNYWISRRQIPFIKIGRTIRFDLEEIERTKTHKPEGAFA